MIETTLRNGISTISQQAVLKQYEGYCFRNVQLKYADKFSIRSAIGSLLSGGRFNFNGKFGALYLSENPLVCMEEATAFSEASLNFSHSKAKQASVRVLPRIFVGFSVKLSKILDLTSSQVLNDLGISTDQIVAGGWQTTQLSGNEALTQTIGRIAREEGFEAVVANSAKCQGRNIVVFCENLKDTSAIKVIGLEKLFTNASWDRLPEYIKGTTTAIVQKNWNKGLSDNYLEATTEYCERIKSEQIGNHEDSILEGCLRIVRL